MAKLTGGFMKMRPTRKNETVVLILIFVVCFSLTWVGLFTPVEAFPVAILMGAIVSQLFVKRRGDQSFRQESMNILDLTTLNLSPSVYDNNLKNKV
jgi:TRAP-type C4-dicarboxylate transport system permease large subunit